MLLNLFGNMDHVVKLWNYGTLWVQLSKRVVMGTDLVMEECDNVRGDNWSKYIVNDCQKG